MSNLRPEERRVTLNRLAVEVALRAERRDDYSLDADDRDLDRAQVDRAVSRVRKLAECALAVRPSLADGIAGYGLGAESLILSVVQVEHDPERGRIVVYRLDRRAAGPLVSIPASALLAEPDAAPGGPTFVVADPDDDDDPPEVV